MRTVSFSEFQSNPEVLNDITEILTNDGIICIPTPSGYKLMADLESSKAVMAMIQAKRRVKSAPALVMIPDQSHVENIAESVSEEASKLMTEFWPGPVTLLFSAGDGLHPKIRKALTKAKGWLGVRVPNSQTAKTVVGAFGKPLLVSSANISKKAGDGSLAQVKKNFGRAISLLIEDGDITTESSSTLVDVTREIPKIVRCGAVAEQSILDALAG
ncbi:MAG: threonylcarbamoyl-AMP synthase [Deltaproteobacteria bacterium]|nr:threonylcarbamoyl-AMP synthase [Deltaproteobacteria bacterium]MBN2674576.1 threonylcarbamoyl-AMP synthase [Deltaproteobacteria bacterium]